MNDASDRAVDRLRRATVVTAASMLALSARAAGAGSSNYPNRAIRLVVPAQPAAPLDTVARRVAESLAQRLGQPVVVDNRAGANGVIGVGEVARSPADGYTLLVSIQDPLIAAAATVKALPYDPSQDLRYITVLARSSAVLVSAAGRGIDSVAALIAKARKERDRPLPYGSWGPGSLPQLVIEQLGRRAGAPFLEVRYRGSPAAMQDMLAGQIDFTITSAPVAVPLAAAGKIVPIAAVGPKRSPLMPAVPTHAELGYPDLVLRNGIWSGLIGPAALPPPIVALLEQEVRRILAEPRIVQAFTELGLEPVGNPSADFRRDYLVEYAMVTRFLKTELRLVAE